jgi:hypothetical protein
MATHRPVLQVGVIAQLVLVVVSLSGCTPMSDAARVWCADHGRAVYSAADKLGFEIAFEDYLHQSGDNYARACNAAFEGR